MSDNVHVLPTRRTTATAPAADAGSGAKGAQVAERIREMIIQDLLPPGAPVRERMLAERLNVSRTPLREALKMLATEGLVELHPNRGAIVAAPSNEEVRELLLLLGVLEGYAAELACELITEAEMREMRALHFEMLADFTRGDRLSYFHRNQSIHMTLTKASRNRALIAQHRIINARVYRARYVCTLRTLGLETAITEHEAILAALERRDGPTLNTILRGHVVHAWDKMQEALTAEAAATATPLVRKRRRSGAAQVPPTD
ncbi:GntR family transcriptional regulator [Chelatococcus sp. GCM10030263]|uniref:GntR family transcriptional regulator n=1 Tax=Chelatococcus sp. GCM10030263 TaxID=3273387 RepID=UPI00361DEC16